MPRYPVSTRLLIAVALAACAALALLATPAGARSPVVHGVKVRAHPARGHRHARHGRRRSHPVLVAHPKRLARAKGRAGRRYRRLRGRQTPPPQRFARATVFSGLNAPGFAYPIGIGGQPVSGYSSPPDSTGAIGPADYVEFVNSKVAVYDRTLGLKATANLDDFVNATGQNGSGDPQIQWDPESGRWYYLTYDDNDTVGAALDFGWSKTASPLPLDDTGWCKFQLSTGTEFPDYPKLGHDDSRILIGANMFPAGDEFGSQITASIFSIPKPGPPAQGDTCTPPSYTRFGTAGGPLKTDAKKDAATPVPANTTDSAATGYIVAAEEPNNFVTGCATTSAIQIWHVSGSSLVSDGEPSVPKYCYPASAAQPGSPNELDTLDARLTQAVAHADPDAGGAEAVWTQHTVNGAGSRSVVRWYELVPSAADQTRQVGTVADPSNFVFNGAVSPAANGTNAAVFFDVSGPSQRPAIRARVRSGPDPAGELGHSNTLVSSTSTYGDFSCDPGSPGDPAVCRWGDYAAASPDPLNDDVVWGTNMYSGGSRWLTRNFAVRFQPGTPTAVLDATPSTIQTGQTITFDSSRSTDPPDATIVDHRWDLDSNGSFETDTGASAAVTRNFPTAGSFIVRVRVTDSYNDTSDAVAVVNVDNPPPPGPSAACLKARKRVAQLKHSVKKLKKRIKRTDSSGAKRRYRKSLKHRNRQLRKARKTAKRACA